MPAWRVRLPLSWTVPYVPGDSVPEAAQLSVPPVGQVYVRFGRVTEGTDPMPKLVKVLPDWLPVPP